MKKNKPYYLKMYLEWLEAGKLPSDGLCWSFDNADSIELLNLFSPTKIHPKYGWMWYWGFDGSFRRLYFPLGFEFTFTPLRQTILLFMAAMNNEL